MSVTDPEMDSGQIGKSADAAESRPPPSTAAELKKLAEKAVKGGAATARKTKPALLVLAYAALGLYYLWCVPAVYFLNLPWEWLRTLLAVCFAIAIPAILIVFRKKKWSLWAAAGISLFFGVWFSLIPASNNRDWTTDVARLPKVSIDGSEVTVENLRSFIYKTEKDYVVRYRTETYDLDKLDEVDYILSYWDGNTKVAHSMLSFGFGDGKHLCVSVETRREKGEPQTGLRGLYNQYERIYILADESDLLLLRTNYRHEEVYVYPLKFDKAKAKRLLLRILGHVNSLYERPEFYNTIKHNCFTSVLRDVAKARGRGFEFDIRMLLNGESDQMGYEKGWFETDGLGFEAFKKRSHINQYVEDDPDAAVGFSSKIRSWKRRRGVSSGGTSERRVDLTPPRAIFPPPKTGRARVAQGIEQ